MTAATSKTANRTLTTDAQLMQDYLQSTGILVDTSDDGAGKVAAFQNTEGQAEAIVIGPKGNLSHACREPLSDSGWNMYGLGAGFQGIAASDSSTIWGVGNDASLWRGDNGRWTYTQRMPNDNGVAAASAGSDGTVWALDDKSTLFVKGAAINQTPPEADASITPVVMMDSSDLLNFFCVDTTGALWTIRQTAAGGIWGTWRKLGAPASTTKVARLAVGANQDGRLQVFAIASDKTLHTIWQQALGGNWNAWGVLATSNPSIQKLAVGQDQDGRLEVFALTEPDGSGNSALKHIWQTAPNGGWSPWTDWALPAGTFSDVVVVRDTGGCLQIVLTPESGNAAQWAKQTAPNSGWTSWQAVGGPGLTLSSPSLVLDEDGDLEVFALGGFGSAPEEPGLWHLSQTKGAWTASWTSLGRPPLLPKGAVLEGLVVGRNQGGRLEAFCCSVSYSGRQVYHISQTDNGWSGWNSLEPPSGENLVSLAVVCNQLGSLNLVGLAKSKTLWLNAQAAPAGTSWSGWQSDWWSWYPLAGQCQSGGEWVPFKTAPGGTDTDFWCVAGKGTLVNWNGTTWSTHDLPGRRTVASLAVDTNGTVWILAADKEGTLFRLADGSFEQLPGSLPGATSLAASSSSNIWATAAAKPNEFALHTYRNDAWQAVDAPQLRDMDWNNDPQVSVGRDGSVWLLDGSGNAWKQTMASASWSWGAFPAPQAAATMTHLAAARGGGAWGVDSSGAIWQFAGAWSAFRHPLPSGTMAQVSSGAPGTIWAIDTKGVPFRYSKGSWESVQSAFQQPLVQSPASWAIGKQTLYQYNVTQDEWTCTNTWTDWDARQASVGTDGSVWIVDTAGQLRSHSDDLKVVPGAPPGLVQVAVVDASRMWGITRDPITKAYALHLYSEGAWQEVVTSAPLFSGTTVEPQLSSGGDGTVWLLDTSGTPRTLGWSPRQADWYAKGKSMSFRSISSANVNDSALTTAQLHEAWAVTKDGLFRRNFGNAWLDTYTALPNGAVASQVSIGTDGSMWALDDSGNLYRKTASVQEPASVLAGAATAGTDGGGQLSVFCLDDKGKPWVRSKLTAKDYWLDWTPLSTTQTFTSLISGEDQDGILEVFCLSGDGVVYHAWQDETASNGWSELWVVGKAGQPSGVSLTQLAAGRDKTDLLYLFALGEDGNIHLAWQDKTATGGWSGWAALPAFSPGKLQMLATGKDPGGELEVFALDNSGIAHHSWQDSTAAPGWSDWAVLGATGQPPNVTLSGLATGNHKDDPLYVFGVGSDGSVHAIHGQPSGHAGWSDWAAVGPIAGGVTPFGLQTGSGPGGVFAVLAQGSDGAIYSATQQPGAPTGWSAWAPLGAMGTAGRALQAPIFGAGEDGVPRVFAVGAGSVWQTRPQSTGATGWRDWTPLSGRQPWQACGGPAFSQAPAGSADGLWAVGSDGSIQNSTDAGSSWKAVSPPGASAANPAGVSVGVDGAVWAVTKNGLYRYEGGKWGQVAGQSFARAPVGSANNLWTTDTEGKIHRSRDGGATWWPDTSYSGTARQLSMCADGSIWLLDEDGTTSLAPAWQRVMRPTGMSGFPDVTSVTEVVAGQDENGTRYVFFVQGGTLYYTYELSHHAWPNPTSLAQGANLSNIGLTNQQDTGELIVYTPPTEGTTLVARKASGQKYAFSPDGWNFSIPSRHPRHPSAFWSDSLELSAIDAGHWYWFSVSENGLWSGAGQGSDVTMRISGTQPAPLKKLLRLPWPRNAATPYCAVMDGDGQIWMAEFEGEEGYWSETTYQALTGEGTAIPAGTTLAAAILQADVWTPPQPRIYALAGNTQASTAPALWMRCLTNVFASPAEAWAWSVWTPLGGDYPGLFNGPALAATDTLFTVGGTDSLNALQQNPMTGVWREGLVKRPSQAPDEIETISTYQIDATIYDGNNTPEAKVPVTIFAASPVEAWVDNTLYPLGPVHGITVPTNAMGKLHVRMLAEGLHAPQLTFHADGLDGASLPGLSGGGAVAVSASQHVYDFLQGKGTLPVNGGQPSKLTPDALQNATVVTKPRQKNKPLSPNLSSKQAKQAAKDIPKVAKMPGSSSASTAAVSAVTVVTPEHLLGGFFSHLWDDIKHGLETLAHAIKKGIIKAGLEIAKDTVMIVASVAKGVVQTIKLVVHKIEDAIHVIEMYIKKVIADIEEFIKWMMLLFDWENILKTQEWLKSLIKQLVSVLEQKIGTAESEAVKVFKDIKADIKKAFKTMTASGKIGKYSTFGDLPSSFSGLSASTALSSRRGAGPALRQQAQSIPRTSSVFHGSSSVHHDAFLYKVLDHLTPSFSIPAIPGLDPTDFLDKLDINNVVSEILSAAQDLEKFLQTLFTDPTKLASMGIVDLLKAMESFLLALVDLAEDLIEAVLAIMKTILAGTLDVLEHSVDIPVIGTLFKFLTGEDMTLLNLGTLLAAVPLYVLYVLVFHGMPFKQPKEDAAAPGMTEGQWWATIYLILGWEYAILAAMLDLLTIALTPVGVEYRGSFTGNDRNPYRHTIFLLTIPSFILALLMQVAGWPDTEYFPFFASLWPAPTPAWVAIWFNFCLYFVPPLWNLVAQISYEQFLGGDIQNSLTVVVGVLAVLSGIVAAALGGSDGLINWEYATELALDGINMPFALYLIGAIRQEIWESSDMAFDPAWIVFCADLLINIGMPILNMFADGFSEAAAPEGRS